MIRPKHSISANESAKNLIRISFVSTDRKKNERIAFRPKYQNNQNAMQQETHTVHRSFITPKKMISE